MAGPACIAGPSSPSSATVLWHAGHVSGARRLKPGRRGARRSLPTASATRHLLPSSCKLSRRARPGSLAARHCRAGPCSEGIAKFVGGAPSPAIKRNASPCRSTSRRYYVTGRWYRSSVFFSLRKSSPSVLSAKGCMHPASYILHGLGACRPCFRGRLTQRRFTRCSPSSYCRMLPLWSASAAG